MNNLSQYGIRIFIIIFSYSHGASRRINATNASVTHARFLAFMHWANAIL